jgi:hypothetical protein
MAKIDNVKYLMELRRLLRKVYRQKGSRGRTKLSQGEQLRIIVDRQQRSSKLIPPDIQLWLALFDEAIAFWFLVWGFYRQNVTGPSDCRLICLTALAGRIFQDMICVRDLVERGFFIQSNVVARSLIEAIDVMHLLNSNPQLAEKFRCIEGNADATQFWHEHCSRGKIHKTIKLRWLWFFNGDAEIASAFHGLRDEYLDLVGMSAHPSFRASFVTFMDSSDTRESSIAYNAMGSISHMSKFTIHLILLRVFEYGFLWAGPEIGLYKSQEQLKAEPYLYENIAKGLSMMLSIVQTVDDSHVGDPFYPEFRTYWPMPNKKAG